METIKKTTLFNKVLNFKKLFTKRTKKELVNKPKDQIIVDKKVHVPEKKRIETRKPYFESQLLKKLKIKRNKKNRVQKISRIINRAN
jgi:hypothetical protein